MKLVVTGTNVLIDVLDCHLVQAFFDLPLEIHTTEFILAELNEIQRAALIPFVATDHLKVKKFDELEMRAIMEFPVTRKGVQRRIADRSALYLAVCWGAVLLGGDNDLRKEAEERQVEVHGSIWLFEVLSPRGHNRGTNKEQLGTIDGCKSTHSRGFGPSNDSKHRINPAIYRASAFRASLLMT